MYKNIKCFICVFMSALMFGQFGGYSGAKVPEDIKSKKDVSLGQKIKYFFTDTISEHPGETAGICGGAGLLTAIVAALGIAVSRNKKNDPNSEMRGNKEDDSVYVDHDAATETDEQTDSDPASPALTPAVQPTAVPRRAVSAGVPEEGHMPENRTRASSVDTLRGGLKISEDGSTFDGKAPGGEDNLDYDQNFNDISKQIRVEGAPPPVASTETSSSNPTPPAAGDHSTTMATTSTTTTTTTAITSLATMGGASSSDSRSPSPEDIKLNEELEVEITPAAMRGIQAFCGKEMLAHNVVCSKANTSRASLDVRRLVVLLARIDIKKVLFL